MGIRRVVTDQGSDGRSRVVTDEVAEDVTVSMMPGVSFNVLWGADALPSLAQAAGLPRHEGYFPPAGGVRFCVNVLPPEAAASAPAPAMPMSDQAKAEGVAEVRAKLPGLMEVMDPSNPGWHRTDTVDLVYVVAGRVTLETDASDPVELGVGDSVIQCGARHAWRNTGTDPVTLVTVALGVAG